VDNPEFVKLQDTGLFINHCVDDKDPAIEVKAALGDTGGVGVVGSKDLGAFELVVSLLSSIAVNAELLLIWVVIMLL
jgi:hypothetical protein